MNHTNRDDLNKWSNNKEGVKESTPEMLGRIALAIEHLTEVLDYGFVGGATPGTVERISMSLDSVAEAVNSVAGAIVDGGE